MESAVQLFLKCARFRPLTPLVTDSSKSGRGTLRPIETSAELSETTRKGEGDVSSESPGIWNKFFNGFLKILTKLIHFTIFLNISIKVSTLYNIIILVT